MFANTPVATIHLDHIVHNFELAKAQCRSAKTMAVIKANAYGHGIAEVAQALEAADNFAVARVVEAVDLRRSQPNKPIVVLEGYLGAQERDACIEYRLTPMIHNDAQLELLPLDLAFWLKFNTGMFRLGFSPTRARELSDKLTGTSLVGIASHFANADLPEHALNLQQLKAFKAVQQHFPDAQTCIANSGGLLNIAIKDELSNWTRPGLMIYGGSPSETTDPRLKPGMTLSAPVIAINHLQAGDQVGYGSTWQASTDTRVAVVALGYADGYPREMPSGTPVLVAGARRQVVGRVSMDMCTVLLHPEDDVSLGDRVIFWGEGLCIDEIATCATTLSYTLMTGLGPRVQRVYTT